MWVPVPGDVEVAALAQLLMSCVMAVSFLSTCFNGSAFSR